MPHLHGVSYHQMVAQNFLRNISLDGSHEDTSLRIFKVPGFQLQRQQDIAPGIVHSTPLEGKETANSDFDRISEEKAVNIAKPEQQPGRRRVPVQQTPRENQQERWSARKLVGKGYSSIESLRHRGRGVKEKQGRDRLNSVETGDLNFGKRYRRQFTRRSAETVGEGGLLEKLKAPFSHHNRRRDVLKATSSASAAPTDPATCGRSVKWGALPAVASLDSMSGTTSVGSKAGEVVVVGEDFNDTRAKGSRICFCQKQLPVFIYSVLPLGSGALTAFRRPDPSTDSKSLSSNEDVGLKPLIEEISYSHMLIPSRVPNQTGNVSASSDTLSYLAISGQSSSSSAYGAAELQIPEPSALNVSQAEAGGQKQDVFNTSDISMDRSSMQLDFRQFDDPEFGAGKHKTILTFTSYMTSIIDYVNRDEMKREVNDKFRKRFPDIRLTYSKYQSLKRDMKSIAASVGLDLLTLAQAYSYFDKIVLKALISKTNRKLVAAACLLLGAKMNDVKGADLTVLLDKLEDVFRLNRKEFVQYELPVAVALEFSLHIPVYELYGQYQKLLWSS